MSIRPHKGKFLLTVSADGHTRNYQYASFAAAYRRAKRLCDFLDLKKESAIKKETKGVIL
ncbi:MAG: hypothetical protein ABFD50_05145 [Smithella sp.]